MTESYDRFGVKRELRQCTTIEFKPRKVAASMPTDSETAPVPLDTSAVIAHLISAILKSRGA